MKALRVILLLVSLVPPLFADKTTESETARKLDLPTKFLDSDVRPATLDEAANYIASLMTNDEKLLFLSTSKDDLIRFHMTLGMGIRNKFGLWGGNSQLRTSIGLIHGLIHPDDVSFVIIQRVWDDVRRDAGAEVVSRVDAMAKTLNQVVPPIDKSQWTLPTQPTTAAWHRTTTWRALVAEMNAAVERSLQQNGPEGYMSVRIEVVGIDLSSRIVLRNSSRGAGRASPVPQSLREILRQVGYPFRPYLVLFEYPVVRIYAYPSTTPTQDQK